MRRRHLIVLVLVLGIALIVVGVLVGTPTETQGVVFDRPVSERRIIEYASESTGAELLSPRDGNLWIGAGVALVLVAAAGSIADRRGRRSTSVWRGPQPQIPRR